MKPPAKKPWWAWPFAIAVTAAVYALSQSHPPAPPPPTAEQADRARLERQWETVVAERRQREADFERRTRPH